MKKGKGKGRGRGKAPNTSSAPDPRPGSSITAELEEGLPVDTALMEVMDRNRPLAEGQVFQYSPAQEEALVEWFRDNTFFYDKASTDFKNRMKKERLVKDISEKL